MDLLSFDDRELQLIAKQSFTDVGLRKWEQNRGSSEQERTAPRGGHPPITRISEEKMEAPPGFEPGMEVLQIERGRASCCLVLVFGRSSSPALPRVWALLDYVWTTAPGDFLPSGRCCRPAFAQTGSWREFSPIRSLEPDSWSLRQQVTPVTQKVHSWHTGPCLEERTFEADPYGDGAVRNSRGLTRRVHSPVWTGWTRLHLPAISDERSGGTGETGSWGSGARLQILTPSEVARVCADSSKPRRTVASIAKRGNHLGRAERSW
jgi:hypothetical protein